MDITLTLSPITPLDVQFDTPSPSPPIVGHPIPWNLLEAHGDSCLCCIHNRKGMRISGYKMLKWEMKGCGAVQEGSSSAGKADPSASTSQDASSRSERPLEVSQEELWTSVDRVRSERNVVLDSDWTSEFVLRI
ncbi:hypothetical protein Tco_1449066 [Tanacetum coccineum]